MKMCSTCGRIFNRVSLDGLTNSCPILDCAGPLIDAKGDDFERAVQILNYKGYQTLTLYAGDINGGEIYISFIESIYYKAFPNIPNNFYRNFSTKGNLIFRSNISGISRQARLRVLGETKKDLLNWAINLPVPIAIEINVRFPKEENSHWIVSFLMDYFRLFKDELESNPPNKEGTVTLIYFILIPPNEYEILQNEMEEQFFSSDIDVSFYEHTI